MMRYAAPVSVMLALPLAACAAPPSIVPGRVHEVKAYPLLPYQAHEECAELEPGDRLEYSFDAAAPLHFNIHYHEGKAVIMPVTHDNLKADRGEFDVLTAQEYCLVWEAGAGGTALDYRVRLIPPRK